MSESMQDLARLAVAAFVVTGMVAAGLGLTVQQIMIPFQRGRMITPSLVANFVVAPTLAYALTWAFNLERSYEIGLLLLGGAAGAPFLPKLASVARGDLAFSVGLMLLLIAGSVAFMPLVLPWMIPGFAADAWPILRPLLATMLVPLVVGMCFRRYAPITAALVRPIFTRVSNGSMVVAITLLIGLNFRAMIGTIGSGVVAIGVVFVAASTAAGHLLGGPDPRTRCVLALGTGQRNIAAALVVAAQNFDEPGVVTMLLVTTFAGLAVLLAASRWMARRIP